MTPSSFTTETHRYFQGPAIGERPVYLHRNLISDDSRFRLIEMVIHRRLKVKEASIILGINYQTAKSILRRFKNTGTFYEQYALTLEAPKQASLQQQFPQPQPSYNTIEDRSNMNQTMRIVGSQSLQTQSKYLISNSYDLAWQPSGSLYHFS